MSQPAASPRNDDARRRGVRRTVWIVGTTAVAVFVGFMLMAVLK